MTTPLPTRLRASAQAMRQLFLVSENVPNVRMIYKEDRDRIARELEEAAGALEVQPVAWRVRGYAQFKTGKPGPWRYVDGPERPAVNNKDCCDFEPLYAAPAQVALEAQQRGGAGVAPDGACRACGRFWPAHLPGCSAAGVAPAQPTQENKHG